MSEIIGTLIKIGIALFLVAVVVVLGAKGYKSSEVASEQQNVATIVSSVKALYANTPTYTGLNLATAVEAGVFPKDMVSGNGTSAKVYNRWKGTVDVEADGSDSNKFDVTYTNVPQDACINLLSNFKDGSMVDITVNDVSVPSVPPTPTDAASACGNKEANTIKWSFR